MAKALAKVPARALALAALGFQPGTATVLVLARELVRERELELELAPGLEGNGRSQE